MKNVFILTQAGCTVFLKSEAHGINSLCHPETQISVCCSIVASFVLLQTGHMGKLTASWNFSDTLEHAALITASQILMMCLIR